METGSGARRTGLLEEYTSGYIRTSGTWMTQQLHLTLSHTHQSQHAKLFLLVQGGVGCLWVGQVQGGALSVSTWDTDVNCAAEVLRLKKTELLNAALFQDRVDGVRSRTVHL